MGMYTEQRQKGLYHWTPNEPTITIKDIRQAIQEAIEHGATEQTEVTMGIGSDPFIAFNWEM